MIFFITLFIISLSFAIGIPLNAFSQSGSSQNSADEKVEQFLKNWLFTEEHWRDLFIPGERIEQQRRAARVLGELGGLLLQESNSSVLNAFETVYNDGTPFTSRTSNVLLEAIISCIENEMQSNPPQELINLVRLNLDLRTEKRGGGFNKHTYLAQVKDRYNDGRIASVADYVQSTIRMDQFVQGRHQRDKTRDGLSAKNMITSVARLFRAAYQDTKKFNVEVRLDLPNVVSDENVVQRSKSQLTEKPEESSLVGEFYHEVRNILLSRKRRWRGLLVRETDPSLLNRAIGQRLYEDFVLPIYKNTRVVEKLNKDYATVFRSPDERNFQTLIAHTVTVMFSSEVPSELTRAVADRLYYQRDFQTRDNPVRQFVEAYWRDLGLSNVRPKPADFRQKLLECTQAMVDHFCHRIEGFVNPNGEMRFEERQVAVSLKGVVDSDGEFIGQKIPKKRKAAKKVERVEPLDAIERLERQIPQAASNSKSWRNLAPTYAEHSDSLKQEVRRAVAYLTFFNLVKTGWLPVSEKTRLNPFAGIFPSAARAGTRTLLKILPHLQEIGIQPADMTLCECDPSRNMHYEGSKFVNSVPFKVDSHVLDITQKGLKSLEGRLNFFIDLSMLPYLNNTPNASGISGRVWALIQAQRIVAPNGYMLMQGEKGFLPPEYIKTAEALGFVLEVGGRNLSIQNIALFRMAGADGAVATEIQAKLENSELYIFRRTDAAVLDPFEAVRLIDFNLPDVPKDRKVERKPTQVLEGKYSFENTPLASLIDPENRKFIVNLRDLVFGANAELISPLQNFVSEAVLANWRGLLSGRIDPESFHEGLVTDAPIDGTELREGMTVERIVADEIKRAVALIAYALEDQSAVRIDNNLEVRDPENEGKVLEGRGCLRQVRLNVLSVEEKMAELAEIDILRAKQEKAEIEERLKRVNRGLEQSLSELIKEQRWTDNRYVRFLARRLYERYAEDLLSLGYRNTLDVDYLRGFGNALIRCLNRMPLKTFASHLRSQGKESSLVSKYRTTDKLKLAKAEYIETFQRNLEIMLRISVDTSEPWITGKKEAEPMASIFTLRGLSQRLMGWWQKKYLNIQKRAMEADKIKREMQRGNSSAKRGESSDRRNRRRETPSVAKNILEGGGDMHSNGRSRSHRNRLSPLGGSADPPDELGGLSVELKERAGIPPDRNRLETDEAAAGKRALEGEGSGQESRGDRVQERIRQTERDLVLMEEISRVESTSKTKVNAPPHAAIRFLGNYRNIMAGQIGSAALWGFIDNDYSDFVGAVKHSLTLESLGNFAVFAGVQSSEVAILNKLLPGYTKAQLAAMKQMPALQLIIPERFAMTRYMAQHGLALAGAMWVSGLLQEALRTGDFKAALKHYKSGQVLVQHGISAGSFMIARMPITAFKALKAGRKFRNLYEIAGAMNKVRRGVKSAEVVGGPAGVAWAIGEEVVVFFVAHGIDRFVIPKVNKAFAKKDLAKARTELRKAIENPSISEEELVSKLDGLTSAVTQYEQGVVMGKFYEKQHKHSQKRMAHIESAMLAIEMSYDFNAWDVWLDGTMDNAQKIGGDYNKYMNAMGIYNRAVRKWNKLGEGKVERVAENTLACMRESVGIATYADLLKVASEDRARHRVDLIEAYDRGEVIEPGAFTQFIKCMEASEVEEIDRKASSEYRERYLKEMGYSLEEQEESLERFTENGKEWILMPNQFSLPLAKRVEIFPRWPETMFEVRLYHYLVLGEMLERAVELFEESEARKPGSGNVRMLKVLTDQLSGVQINKKLQEDTYKAYKNDRVELALN